MAFNVFTPRPSTEFFIDPVFLKATTSLNNNVDDKIIQEAIQTASDMYLLPILGSTLMWEMLYAASGGTLSGQYQNLVINFVQPCLANAAMMEVIPNIWIQMKNKGPMKQHSEFSDETTLQEVDYMIERYRKKAAFYAQRTTNWLMDNIQTFPEWQNAQLYNTSSGADLFYPNLSSYSTGMFNPTTSSNSPFNQYRGFGLSWGQYFDFINNRV